MTFRKRTFLFFSCLLSLARLVPNLRDRNLLNKRVGYLSPYVPDVGMVFLPFLFCYFRTETKTNTFDVEIFTRRCSEISGDMRTCKPYGYRRPISLPSPCILLSHFASTCRVESGSKYAATRPRRTINSHISRLNGR